MKTGEIGEFLGADLVGDSNIEISPYLLLQPHSRETLRSQRGACCEQVHPAPSFPKNFLREPPPS